MSAKSLVWVGMVLGSLIGSVIPVIFGASAISGVSILGSGVGGVAGVILGWKLSKYL